MTNPAITKIGPERYSIDGGDMAAEWRASLRPGETGICELTISDDGVVRSFGGQVWPSAWPHLFSCPSNLSRGATVLTPAGVALFCSSMCPCNVHTIQECPAPEFGELPLTK